MKVNRMSLTTGYSSLNVLVISNRGKCRKNQETLLWFRVSSESPLVSAAVSRADAAKIIRQIKNNS